MEDSERTAWEAINFRGRTALWSHIPATSHTGRAYALHPGDVARSRCHVRAYVELAPQEASRALDRPVRIAFLFGAVVNRRYKPW